jgi:hypothetical protein
MPTKNPRVYATFASKDEYARVRKFLQKEFKSVNMGLRYALNDLLRRYEQEPLEELQWGGQLKGKPHPARKRTPKKR